MILIERAFERDLFESVYDDGDFGGELTDFMESADSHIIVEEIYPKIQDVLSTPQGDRKFKMLVGKYMDRNIDKLHTPGPLYLIPFGDTDKKEFFDLFDLTSKEVVGVVNKVIKGLNSNSDFKLLRNNPIFWVFYCCIRYYHIRKDQKGLNTSLAIYALSVYPSVFSLFFKHGADEGVMQYTIDNLTDQFLIKRHGHIFGALFVSINNSYTFLKQFMNDGSDLEIIRFIQRIRNDQKSMIKNICNKYMENYEKGLRVSLTKDSNSEIPINDDTQNKTSTVEFVTQKVALPMLTDGVNMTRAGNCAKIAGVSISEVRFYISKILTDKNSQSIKEFIESILFMYLYDANKTKEEINSKEFLLWSSELFRKTNSNNANIKKIKDTLNNWSEDIGIHEKFRRESSRVCYKKAIFFYFILSIQTYNN